MSRPEPTPSSPQRAAAPGSAAAPEWAAAPARTPSRALTSAPVLAHVVRCGTVESLHHGCAVVTAPDGSVQHAWGEPSDVVFPRSANKPLQAVGLLEVGLQLPPPQVAVACASHSGEPYHLDTVRAILAGVGLDETALRNTPGYPVDLAASEAWIRAGRGPASITQNCSGKHAAMLATAAHHGWACDTYLDPDHPVQQAVTRGLERVTGERVHVVAVDGCGAPLHGIPLVALARAFGRLASAAAGSAEGRVADAMRAHPDLVGGTGRQVTALMREAPGVVAKDGAEAVYAVGLADGRGVAVKIADGHTRAKAVVLAAVLRHVGAVPPAAYRALAHAPVLGHGVPVGAVEAVGI